MKPCIVEKCENPSGPGKGMCHKHYKRWRNYGTTDLINPQGCPDPYERLSIRGRRTESGCLEWTGRIGASGYGQTKFARKFYSVHRLAWELAYGPIPDGMVVMHKCDNPRCYETSHLAIGTPADNSADRDSKGRGVVGSKVNTAKINEHQAAYIFSATEPAKMLAEQFGLALSTIYRIKGGKYWRRAIQANQRRGA